MGVGEVYNLPDLNRPQNVQESVSYWLRSSCRDFYKTENVSGCASLQGQCPCSFHNNVNQDSAATVDDNASVSDLTHDSSSSGSSSHISWTNTTDPVDVLSDEDEKEHVHELKPGHGSHTSANPQEHLLKGLQPTAPTACVNLPCLLENACNSLRLKVLETPQKCAQAAAERPDVDATAGNPGERATFRRPSCSNKNQICPPRLKRDTDVTDHFVTLLIIFATRIITAIWPLSACPPMMSTCFNGAGVLPLRVFIQETLRRSKTSYSTLQVALYYLILLKAKLPHAHWANDSAERSPCRAMQCGRRMFLSALMLASKYLQDRNYSARAWSKISGLRSSEINDNEREYLRKIDYNLHVPKEHFDNWSKVVLALSKLSKEPPKCRSSLHNLDLGSPGSGSSAILANMVAETDVDHSTAETTFSEEWWTDVILKLDPTMIKDSSLVEDFLQQQLPKDKIEQVQVPIITRQPYRSWGTPPSSPDAVAQVYDMNFSDTLKPRNAEQCQVQAAQTPRTPVQSYPARNAILPLRLHLRNLPTPQTTPRMSEQCTSSTNTSTPFVRCSASVDALRSMRRQCISNANLERCPPPQPNGCDLPPVRSLMRPAETIREIPSRSPTPSSWSPASIASDLTALTSRSRSSSISSASSWSSLASAVPRLRIASGGRSSSPLAKAGSLSERWCMGEDPSKKVAVSSNHFRKRCHQDAQPAATPIKVQADDYGSEQELRNELSQHGLPSTSEVDAVHVLMSLSAQLDTSSHSVTPTPKRLATYGCNNQQEQADKANRGHKRTLSISECIVPSEVRRNLLNREVPLDAAEDIHRPYSGQTSKQWQLPTKEWADARMALPTSMGSKRVATYCSMQQIASAPDLALQYLKDSIIIAS